MHYSGWLAQAEAAPATKDAHGFAYNDAAMNRSFFSLANRQVLTARASETLDDFEGLVIDGPMTPEEVLEKLLNYRG